MTAVYCKPFRLNVLSCAVEGKPGRSAYETAVAGGYPGTPEEFAASLASLPGTLNLLGTYNGRVDAILEYMGDQIASLESAAADLERRVRALEGTP